MRLVVSLKTFFFGKKLPVAPFQTTQNIPPQENYAGYTTLPNLPMGSLGDFVPDPYRLHASFPEEREKDRLITNGGVEMYDAGNEAVIAVPRSSLQAYFDQKATVEPQVIFIPGSGVFVPDQRRQAGYRQAFVHYAGMRSDISFASPAVLLSTPLRSRSVDSTSGRRASLTAGKAPKLKRGI